MPGGGFLFYGARQPYCAFPYHEPEYNIHQAEYLSPEIQHLQAFYKSMVKGFESAYVAGEKPFTMEVGGVTQKFVAKELGYLAIQAIAARATRFNLNGAALLVVESIETVPENDDERPERFTYDQVQKLKKEYAEILFKAANEINPLDASEKKN